MSIAEQAHQGQRDKGGMPYIMHPLYIANHMDDEMLTCVALLHDVVEDSDFTLEDLKDFPDCVVEAVNAITKRPNEDYMKYLKRVKENSLARTVKLADLTHNMDRRRFPGMSDTAYDKYAKAKNYLKEN